MRTLTATFYTPNGNSIEVFDYKALQTEMNAVDSALNVLQQSAVGVDERLKQLEHEVTNLKSLERIVTTTGRENERE